MTPHIEAKKGEIAKTVIMPGDPKRAKFIADNYLKDVKLVSSVRGILALTGTYKSKEVTIMASGMGMPSIGIYSYELYKFYEVEQIIRIGTCGALQNEVNIRDIIIPTEAYTSSNFAYQHSGKQKDKEYPSDDLTKKLIETAKNLDINVLTGTINTSDLFYTEYEDQKVKENNPLAVEMETFALFYIANSLNKKASSVLTVTDHILKGQKLTSEEREQSLNDAIKIILETL